MGKRAEAVGGPRGGRGGGNPTYSQMIMISVGWVVA